MDRASGDSRGFFRGVSGIIKIKSDGSPQRIGIAVLLLLAALLLFLLFRPAARTSGDCSPISGNITSGGTLSVNCSQSEIKP